MKLNLDCLRLVMIEIEKRTELTVGSQFEGEFVWVPVSDIADALPKQRKEDVLYTVLLLDEAGFIVSAQHNANNRIVEAYVLRMTYQGHSFLEKIRDEKHWGILKSVLHSVRDYSLDAVSAAANGMTKAFLETALSEIGNRFPIVGQ